MIKKQDLEKGYSVFGNKGNVWANTAHIYKSGHGTLCKTPALSFNYAGELGMDVGCEMCCKQYKKEVK
jgi:hypothetical protein